MSEKKKEHDDFIISFADLVKICKRGKSKICFGMIFFSVSAILWTLTNPVEYVAEATFKDKARASAGMSISGLLFGSSAQENDAITLIKSRVVGEELVRRLGLQARISRNVPSVPWFENMRDNLIAEQAIFKGSLNPSLSDVRLPIEAKDVIYQAEAPKGLTVKFLTEDTFIVYDGPKQIESTLDQPVESSDFVFTLTRTGPEPVLGSSYNVLMLPLAYEATNISKQMRVEPDRLDRNLLNIKYGHRDRYQACKIVSMLTEVYKDFLRKEQDRIISAQIDYLEKRQNEIGEKLQVMMQSHLSRLSDDANMVGFANTAGAMDYLTAQQNRLQQKLMDIEFETKRLQKIQNEKQAFYSDYYIPGDSAIINNLLTEIRNLKQQGDWIDLALRNSPCADEACSRQAFEEQLASLEENRIYRTQARQMLSDVEQNVMPGPQGKLINDPKYLVKVWYEKLSEIDRSRGIESADGQTCCEQFSAYLKNLIHHFDVHEKAIEERLAHQQSEDHEFQGIDLNTARELYIGYNRQLNEMQGHVLQHEFTIQQMELPEFEMSSLSTLIADPVSGETVMKASRLALELKDQNNRSLKEQERIREELAVQKRFLSLHFKNAIQLLKLKAGLVENKIRSLQHVMLGLIQKQISLSENHVKDYVTARIKDLTQESEIIEEHKKELRSQVAALPPKLVSEMLIDQQIAVNKKTVEEMSRLAESKVIGNNIEIVQSNMIDYPVIPIHPKSPRVFFFAILGAFMGAFLTGTSVVARELITGLQASEVNLKLQGQHVAGILSKTLGNDPDLMLDSDLDTLRRLNAYLCSERKETGQSLLIAKGRSIDYSKEFAALLAKQGLKVLVMPISFESSPRSEELPGLLQYLEGNASQPKILKGPLYDSLFAGGISRFSTELLNNQRFKTLLKELTQKYDWVIAVSQAAPGSGDVENLLNCFDAAVFSITEEKLEDLKTCLGTPKKHAFVIC